MADASTFDWGSLLGGLLGYQSSQGGNTTTSTQSVAPEFQPLASAVGQRAMEIGNMPFNPYPYSMVAGFSPYQFQGLDMMAQQAQNNQLPQQAQGALGGFMSGQNANPYLGANPYLEQNIQNTLGDMTRNYNQTIAPTMAATALKGGSFGNSGAQQAETESRAALARTLGQTAGGMRMQDYGMQQQLAESGLNRQMGALGYAPSIYGLGYAGADRMLGAGNLMQQQAQRDIDAQYKQYQEAQNWPFTTFNAMMAPFGRATGGVSTTNTPTSPWAGAIGGSMIGSQMWNGMSAPAPAPAPGGSIWNTTPYWDNNSYPWQP